MEIARIAAELTAVCEWQAERLSLPAPDAEELPRYDDIAEKIIEIIYS